MRDEASQAKAAARTVSANAAPPTVAAASEDDDAIGAKVRAIPDAPSTESRCSWEP
jgi:hypothetical protein